MKQDWLWDRKISVNKARKILSNPSDRHFLSLAGTLLSRKNTPSEVFRDYIKPLEFFYNWNRIKRQMRRDLWNNPRIEFWQAVYEKLKEKFKERGISPRRENTASRPNYEFCKEIASQIITIRKQKGLTQTELARKLNISQQIISRIESGRENISFLTLKNITDALESQIHLELR